MFCDSKCSWWPATVLVLAIFAAGCVSKEEKIKAIANGVRASIAGSRAHFAAEAAAICGEMPDAETSVVPPLDKLCSRGCRCASASNADVDPRTTYDCDEWQSREWNLIKFAGRYALDGKVRPEVHFHHKASWHLTDEGCRLEFTVYGDLDEDGVYSTYETWIGTAPDGALGHWPDESLLWE